MKPFTAVLTGAFLVWSVGCASPPAAEVDAARAKVQAIAAEDAAYAPDAHKAAQDAVTQLDAEMAAQEQAFAFTRSYDRARELASAAAAAADRVAEAARTERERVRTEAERVAADARRTLGEATASFGQVPKQQAEAVKADVTAAEASLAEVNALLASGQLNEARQKANSVLEAANRVNDAIETARAEAASRPPDETALPRRVLADGKPLPAGAYSLRLAGETTAEGRWVEFVRNGKVAGRALAVVLTAQEAREVAKSPGPGNNEVRVEMLKGNEYLRVWLNRGGIHYLVHLPIA